MCALGFEVFEVFDPMGLVGRECGLRFGFEAFVGGFGSGLEISFGKLNPPRSQFSAWRSLTCSGCRTILGTAGGGGMGVHFTL
jgi:hypothetical protein